MSVVRHNLFLRIYLDKGCCLAEKLPQFVEFKS